MAVGEIMAHALIFDTLAYAKKLKEAGVPDKQAEVQAEAIAEVFSENLATKQDLDLKIAMLKNELIKWVFGISVAQAAFIISCIRLMH
jgi:hypothetical protein